MTTSLNFSNADFSAIKEDLKNFLRQTQDFKDFDFEGSASSMLINMLAYTTNYMALHANMALTEVFLDSCQRRTSAVSRAKELNYFPRQISAARAAVNVSLTFTPSVSSVATLTVPEGTRFSSNLVNGQGFQFVTLSDWTLSNTSGNRFEGQIDIFEGQIVQRKFIYPSTTEVYRFVIPDKNVDTDYFIVKVKEPGDTIYTQYFRETNIVEVENTTNAFFLQEGPDESIELYFGDGIIGYKPAIGSEIVVDYLATNGSAANGVTSFQLDSAPIATLTSGSTESVPLQNVSVSTSEKSAYGAPKQSIESIKFTAPKAYSAQNRAVTEGDYQALLLREFGFIETITVWGGENNDPPMYGKVLVSIKPRDGTRLSPAVKERIKTSVLDKFSVVGIVPDIVDPDYTFVDVFSTVEYEKERTFETESNLSDQITDAIANYFQGVVTKFNGIFRFSNLVSQIDNSNPAILGNNTRYNLIKVLTPTQSALKNYTIRFFNPIVPGSMVSEPVETLDGAILTLVSRENGRIDAMLNGNISQSGIGTINHEKGIIDIKFRFDVKQGTPLNIKVECANQDVNAKQNNLITLRNTQVIMKRWYKNQISVNQ